MASGPHHHQHQHHHQQQQQQQQQQQHQQHVMQHQQSNQMQFTPSHPAGLGTTNYDQHQHLHQQNTMSPSSTAMSINHTQGGIVSMNNHQHHQQQQAQLMGTFVASTMITSGNQSASHIQQQKSQILPLLLSPRPSSLTPTSNDQLEQTGDDHDQIIDQVISLENEYSDTSGMLGSVESGTGGGVMMNNQHQQHHQQQQHQHQHLQHNLGDMNLSASISIPDSNQFSSSSEDLLNLLLEFDREPTNLIGSIQHIDQDEKVGIENIRQQLMSCEMQSEHTNTNSMSPIVSNQMTCQPQQPRVTPQEQQHSQSHNQQQLTQIISQSAPIISHHQLSSTGTSQQQQLSADQSILHGSYSNASMSTVPVSSSGQPYAPQQQQHVTRISQSNPMSIVNSSPSPSWQQPQLSPYSPQPPHNTSRTPSQRQGQHQQHHQIHHPQQQQQQPSHGMQQHQSSTSPQMQQLHHTLQQRSPSQSLSPPATTEPSPVVKKNPLLNAQLVNTRAPSITPTRFMNNQANLLNQNPILNAKLSQNPFVPNNSGNIVGSPVNPSLNSQSRVIQQATQQTNFSYDISQQQQNAQQHTSQQGHVNIFGPSCDQQQQQQQTGNRLYRTNTAGSGAASSGLGNTSPGGNLSQQVKQEIRRKVQPKKQHQTTSLLKQLLSDDNK